MNPLRRALSIGLLVLFGGCSLIGTDDLQAGAGGGGTSTANAVSSGAPTSVAASSSSTSSATASSTGSAGEGGAGGEGGAMPFCEALEATANPPMFCADFDTDQTSIGSPPWGQDPPTSEVGAMDDQSDHFTSGPRGLHVTYAPRAGGGGAGGQDDPFDFVLRRSFGSAAPSGVTLDFELQLGGEDFAQTVADLQWDLDPSTRCRLMIGFVRNGGSLQNQLNERGKEGVPIPTFELDTSFPDTFHHVRLTADFVGGTAALAVDDYDIEFDTSRTEQTQFFGECVGLPQEGSLEIWVGARFIEADEGETFDAYFDDVVLRAFP